MTLWTDPKIFSSRGSKKSGKPHFRTFQSKLGLQGGLMDKGGGIDICVRCHARPGLAETWISVIPHISIPEARRRRKILRIFLYVLRSSRLEWAF